MICRNYRDGQKLDVSGLNEITVLLDRSESGLTEIGYNKWSPSQDGPPHKHPDKDQVFYIHDGVGDVILGGERNSVKPGDLVYVPSGLLHQTITTTPKPLCYVLFNVFNDTSKEGHQTFADHIEKVKAIRRAQADSGRSDADGLVSDAMRNKPQFFNGIYNPVKGIPTSPSSRILLERDQTNRFEFGMDILKPAQFVSEVANILIESSFFCLSGDLSVALNGTEQRVREGDLFFIPAGMAYDLKTGKEGSHLLRISSYLD